VHILASADDIAIDNGTGHCYFKFGTQKSWQSAQSACQAFTPAATLVAITTQAEATLVGGLIGSNGHWGGGSDIANEGNWIYPTGEPVPSFGWENGQPDNGNGTADCQKIRSTDEWDDKPCSEKHRYICERAP